jgi:hypothetical protein
MLLNKVNAFASCAIKETTDHYHHLESDFLLMVSSNFRCLNAHNRFVENFSILNAYQFSPLIVLGDKESDAP